MGDINGKCHPENSFIFPISRSRHIPGHKKFRKVKNLVFTLSASILSYSFKTRSTLSLMNSRERGSP